MSDSFFVGVNLPWLSYGGDFGANAWQPRGGVARPELRARLDLAFARLAGAGLETVRWWLIGDGRAGLRTDGDGMILGVDELFFADVDAGFEAAERQGLRLMPVLIDFLWFEEGKVERGVMTGGRTALITVPDWRRRLLELVFAPIFERYRAHPAVWAWDLINEPEWALRSFRGDRGIADVVMKILLGELVALGREVAAQPLTVGLAGPGGLRVVRRLGLDLYQVHWYDKDEARSPLGRPVSRLGLDAPVLLGEFPTGSTTRAPRDILDTARSAGYLGALAWSMKAEDPFTAWSDDTEAAIASWARDQGLSRA